MRVYIDLDENIDNISELYAYITTRDDKHIRVGGDIKLWATEKTGQWIPYCYQNCKCSMCDYIISEYDSDEFKFCPNCRAKMSESEVKI